MIRKAGYAILAVLTYGILESVLLGYKYYIIFTILTFFMVAFDVVYFNISGSKAINHISVTRRYDTIKFRKNRKFQITLLFENKNPFPVSVHFFDEAIDVLEISGKTGGNITIPENGSYETSYSTIPRYIGKYKLGNITISISDLFHIASVNKTIAMDMAIRISPSTRDIKSIRSEMISSFIYTQGNHYSHHVGQGYNLYGVRPYTFEDDPRFIVWSRYSEGNEDSIMVKEMEEEREITTIFIIDYSIAMNYGDIDRVYDSSIVDIINSAHFMAKNRDNVGFLLYSSKINVYIPPGKSGESISRLEKSVSSILPDGEFRIGDALKELQLKQKKHFLTFIITASRSYIPRKFLNYSSTSIFLIDSESYYEYSPTGKFDGLLIQNMRKKDLENLSRNVKEIRDYGIRCTYVNRKNMLSKIMVEYNYRRSMNAGA
ncbi:MULTISPECIES: DUF58 domain-containing protein [Ferroplasma]|jgi:uncharacterized protein (DUF58 family)|uniref:DUF58 domain-containing protein n=2 Tax=Ferroplasma TaxID=74968 RepID=S0ATC2_FERAC|nr:MULTISPECIES: DUF58 domain-containing protein [Ferroplasma]MCL4348607.1 DUF58 domain-containing protein [Candidatus Thermoplasmatota archaeon]AGO61325.1 hypothetical protein FACI_IFERC00001G1345 [Ferroplasma acidarmanus Fer1]ARD84279.1 hypothetical protein FAD_0358 [Ferroplasma acidiphilum]NOL60861.1 DUF58 domain-containing protein [Ferroplasma acidiphilum]WMT53184.1 MAG: DUF58 domain-containing protein [Ferroplasma acidiphilum]